jgi:MFS family permease
MIDTDLGKAFQTDRAAIAAVLLGVTAFAVAQGLTYPLITLTLQQRGETDAHIGLNAIFYALGFACATLSVNRALHLMRGDVLTIAGLLCCALSLLLMSIFDNFWAWCGLRFMLGVFASTVFIISEAWLNAACTNEVRGRVSGLYGAGLCAGFAIGPLAIPLFGAKSGTSFAVTSIYIAAVAIASALVARGSRTLPEAAPSAGMLKFLSGAPMLVGMVFAYGLADIAAISAMPAYLVHIGFSQGFAATAVTMVALPTAIAQPLIGWLLDRYKRPTIGIVSAIVTSVCFLGIPLLESGTALLAVFAVLGAASFALYTCALTLLGERYSGQALVSGSAGYSLAYAAGSAAGSSTTGLIMTGVSIAAGPIAIGIALGAFALALAVSERQKS